MAHVMASVNAASRQKNCNACVQSKRRCDRRTPICSRCLGRKISCAYGKAPADIGTESRDKSIGFAPYMGSLEFGGSAGSPFPPDLSLDVDYLEAQLCAPIAESLRTSAMDAVSNEDSPNYPFMGLLDSSITGSSQQWLVPTDPVPIAERPSSPADGGAQKAHQKMAKLCVSLVNRLLWELPSFLPDQSSPWMSPLIVSV